jgi:coenzyme F420-reducing hydrogenase delta subunit
MDALHCANPETFVFKALDDGADFVLFDGVGLDDG